MILLDTMLLSELRKVRPDPAVLAFLQNQSPDGIFLSALTIGEMQAGIERLRTTQPEFAAELAQWLTQTELQFAQHILPIMPTIAKLWGRLCVQTGNKGTDNLIAATALCHNLTVVTRNVRHFEATGVRVVDPFAFIAESASSP